MISIFQRCSPDTQVACSYPSLAPPQALTWLFEQHAALARTPSPFEPWLSKVMEYLFSECVIQQARLA